MNKILVPGERERAKEPDDAVYVAKIFAAKEACSKALGTGMSRGVHWQDFEIVPLNRIILSGTALQVLTALCREDRQAQAKLSTFHRDGIVGAIVTLLQTPASR